MKHLEKRPEDIDIWQVLVKKPHDLPPVKPVSHKPHPTQSTFCDLFVKYEH